MNTDKTVNMSATELNDHGDKRTYTVLEIAGLLRISKSKAYELCKQDLFRIIRIGRSVRVSKASFDSFLDDQIK